MKINVLFGILVSNLFLIQAIHNDSSFVIRQDNDLDLVGLLESLLDVPDAFILGDILIIVTQNAILETIDSPNKPDNYDELLDNWIEIINLLNNVGTANVTIGELKPYISINLIFSY